MGQSGLDRSSVAARSHDEGWNESVSDAGTQLWDQRRQTWATGGMANLTERLAMGLDSSSCSSKASFCSYDAGRLYLATRVSILGYVRERLSVLELVGCRRSLFADDEGDAVDGCGSGMDWRWRFGRMQSEQ